jgi:NADH-quinone oxidoreductase subunit N
MPGLLVIHWLMDRYALTPDDTGLLEASAILLALSFALLLGSIPFHMWMPSIASDGEPLAGAFVFTVNNGAIWFLLLAFLESYPDLTAYTRFAPVASGAGMTMVIVGGLFAAAQQSVGRLVGYGALVDSGVALIALGMESELGLSLAFLSLFARPSGLALMAAAQKGLLAGSGPCDRLDALRGVGWKAPWSTLAFLVGGLSTAGLPISVGFAGRWALYRALAPSDLPSVLLMMLASVGVMVGVWRVFAALFWRPQYSDGEASGSGEVVVSEGVVTVILIALAVATCVGVGLFPQLLAPTALRLAGLYSFFAP